MSAGITFSCDGHRNGDSCRGFLPTKQVDIWAAWGEAVKAGWRFLRVGCRDLCPSPNHDEEGRPTCPQDPQHYLDSHAPGGAWYGVGHEGQESPW